MFKDEPVGDEMDVLLPEQAVDLMLVWYWGGEPYAALQVGSYRFAIQLIRER